MCLTRRVDINNVNKLNELIQQGNLNKNHIKQIKNLDNTITLTMINFENKIKRKKHTPVQWSIKFSNRTKKSMGGPNLNSKRKSRTIKC